MAKEVQKYSPEDWIVHAYHGVGRIEATERKRLGGKETTYYRIEMINSTIWIPVDLMDGGQLRPVSNKSDFQQAVKVLKEEPNEMDPNVNIRKNQINDIIAENTPVSTAGLVRDLWARERKKGNLNESERRAYLSLSDRFVQEWAICIGIEIEEARGLLEQALGIGQTQINELSSQETVDKKIELKLD
jgi:RNA polymerase-interacting CarD/CdnL/TRCF family regulator